MHLGICEGFGSLAVNNKLQPSANKEHHVSGAFCLS